jgi:hypothetical protein
MDNINMLIKSDLLFEEPIWRLAVVGFVAFIKQVMMVE